MADFTDRIRNLADDTLAALSFFSRLPVKAPAGRFDLSRSAGSWPLVGLIIAIAPALDVLLNAWLGITPLVSAFLAIAVGMALTGALHEDGLADTADGIGGGYYQAERLAIMRDSSIGAFGALALIFAIGIRVAALAALAVTPSYAVLALLGAAAVSRALALWHWSMTDPARHDGLAYDAGQPDAAALQVGLLTGLIAAIGLLIAFGLAALLGLVLAILAIGFYSPLITRRLGGHTGDTIGAAQQVTETLLFAGLSAAAATPVFV